MNKLSRRVVITGLGAITPVGNDVETFWNNIKSGVCGIDFITRFDTTEFKVKIAAEVKGFDPLVYMDRKEAKRMDVFQPVRSSFSNTGCRGFEAGSGSQ